MRAPIIFWLFFIPPFCLIYSNAHNISVVNGSCLGHQRSILLHMKNNLLFNPTKSLKLVHWNQSESADDCCQWHGVTCNKGLVIALDLSNESISGGLNDSSPLFNLQHLQSLNLAFNDFYAINIPPQLHKLKNLRYLNLSAAGFGRQIPKEISYLRRLVILDLSSDSSLFISPEQNLKLEKPNIATLVQNLTNVTELYLDGVAISAKGEEWGPALSSLEKLRVLSMSSCNLSGPIHFSLANLSDLTSLNLYGNKIGGPIPSWIWQLDSLVSLNLSNNLLTNFEGSFGNLSSSNNLSMVDLSSNQLQGPISFIPKYANYLDYSNNKFSSIIPPDIGNYLPFILTLFLSNNSFHGQIHESFCNASSLFLLDLSHNNLVGTIPKCFSALTSNLEMLNLGGNKLQGHIPDTMFPTSCALRFLDLSDNLLSGTMPKSLVNCKKLQILSLGKNALTGRFPCFLSNISTLRIIGLRHNKLQGSIGCPNGTSDWEMLHIVDLSNNNFSGTIPGALLSSWKAMMRYEDFAGNLVFENVDDYHHAMSLKDILQTKLVHFVANIGRSFQHDLDIAPWLSPISYVDMSSNYFEGPFPIELMQLNTLAGLNFSHNAFSGHIPSYLGNMQSLEYIDLSNNSFSGEIPQELSSLHFLSYLNLSFNHLEGRIPLDGQFLTFGPDSFIGNEGLCGDQLNNNCNNDVEVVQESPPPDSHTTKSLIEWNFLSVELGVIIGFGMFILPLIYWKKWRLWYSKHVDDLLYSSIHKLDFQYVRHEGKTYRVLRWVY